MKRFPRSTAYTPGASMLDFNEMNAVRVLANQYHYRNSLFNTDSITVPMVEAVIFALVEKGYLNTQPYLGVDGQETAQEAPQDSDEG